MPWGRSFYEACLAAPLYLDEAGDKAKPLAAITEELERKRYPQPPHIVGDWQFGCVPERRREEAALIQDIHAFELSNAKLFHAATCHDGTNAFFSMDRQHLLECTRPPFAPSNDEHYFIQQRLQYAVIRLGPPGQQRYVLARSGVIPGDHAGPKCFNRGMMLPVRLAAARYRAQCPRKQLLCMSSFLSPEPLPCHITGFVDDLASKVVGTTCSEVVTEKKLQDSCIKQAMAEVGIQMNLDKEETVLEGPRLREVQYARAQFATCSDDVRYLGMRRTPGQGCSIEVQYRHRAMRQAWAALVGFFISDADLRFRCIVYRSTVTTACLSGLEIAIGYRSPLCRSDIACLQRDANRHAKILLKGHGTRKTESEQPHEALKYAALPAQELLRKCGMIPLFLELRIRRLQWLQSLLKHIDHHDMVLAALLGGVCGLRDPIADDGGIAPGLAHPWLLQVQMDLAALDLLDDVADLIHYYRLPDHRLNPKGLLIDGREQLLAIDMHILRVQFLSVSVPPLAGNRARPPEPLRRRSWTKSASSAT